MDKKFQILSLDGGGIKGLFSSAILTFLEKDLNTDITDHFDLIVGTSTGGIIALGLGLGFRPKAIMEFYLNEGAEIFPPSSWKCLRAKAKQITKTKYSRQPLETALKKKFSDKLLGHSNKRLVIPSYTLSDDDVYLFKTAHNERFSRDYKVPAWQVALATSAAPTYFPCFNKIDCQRLIDGGIWANNPTMVGFAEAVGVLGINPDNISILSIGTSSELVNRPKNLNRGGFFQWRSHALDIALRAQSLGAVKQVGLIIGKDRILRVDPQVPEKLFKMDKITNDEHLAKAAYVSRQYSPDIEKMFLKHQSPQFIPYKEA